MDPTLKQKIRALIESEEDFDAARKELSQVESKNDLDWLALSAEVDIETGEPGFALAALEKILAVAPNDATTLRDASFAASELGRHETAVNYLEHLLAVEGENAAILNDLSFEYNETGRHVPAHLAAVRAELLASGEEQRCTARINTAAALANLGRTSEAMERVVEMMANCTGICGQRESAVELQASLQLPRERKISRR